MEGNNVIQNPEGRKESRSGKEPEPQDLYDILHKKYESETLEKCWKGCIETDLFTDTDGLARNKMI